MAISLTNAAATRSETTTDIWLTPPHIVNDLGPFDLDPCAAPDPRPWPTAARMLTEKDDGLLLPWGREEFVWMNPPYGKKIGIWLDKLAVQGNGIALVFARTETAAFQQHVWPVADTIIFMRGRVQFHRPDGTPSGNCAGCPSVLIGFGERANRTLLAKSAKYGAFFDLRLGRREK